MSTICIKVTGKTRKKIFELCSRNRDGALKPTHPFYVPPIEGVLPDGQDYAGYYTQQPQAQVVHYLVERGLADLERSIAPRKFER